MSYKLYPLVNTFSTFFRNYTVPQVPKSLEKMSSHCGNNVTFIDNHPSDKINISYDLAITNFDDILQFVFSYKLIDPWEIWVTF